MARRRTSNAAGIIYNRFYKDSPERLAELDVERRNAALARRLFALRESAGLTQKELAARVGTTASVISRLEDADYEGHSLSMIQRVAAALDKEVEIRFVSRKKAAG